MDFKTVGEPSLDEGQFINISSDGEETSYYYDNSRDSPPSEFPASFTSSAASKSEYKKRACLRSDGVVEYLRVPEIRWFYRDDAGKKWLPFIGYDSCQLEWKHHKLVVVGDLTDEDEVVLVRGGLYEVDVLNKKCHSVYWSDDTSDVLRGTWFYQSSKQPLDVDLAEKIEKEHMEKFKGQTFDSSGNINSKTREFVHHLDVGDYHIDWYSPGDIYLFWNTTGHRLARSIGQTFGISKASSSGYKLLRGYHTLATLEDKPPPVSHLVFVVHGVGQVMDKRSIIRTCADLSKGKHKVVKKYFPELLSRGCVQRAEFLPVEWRSSLKLDGGLVATITPERLKGLRHVLNSSAMDILYYTSPLYRSEIIKGLQGELNRLYSLFCARNEGFEPNGGKVSIFGHSLGCVITYDILTGWNPIHLYDQYLSHERGVHPDLDTVSEEQKGLAEELQEARRRVARLEDELLATNQVAVAISTMALNFKVENLFCAGSPLGVFLMLRGVRPQGRGSMDHLLPKRICQRLFNIYFPSDPVAYRIEPLIVRHYCTIQPVPVHRFESASHPPYHTLKHIPYSEATKTAEEMKSTDSQATSPEREISGMNEDEPMSLDSPPPPEGKRKSSTGGLWGMWTSWSDTKEPKTSDSSKSPSRFSFRSRWSQSERPDVLEEIQNAVSSADMTVNSWNFSDLSGEEKVELEERIDFELKESSYSSLYYSALTSHTSYWTSMDVALFVMTHLFPEYLETKEK
ncbi:Phospholipase DDHD1 [Holothuria leucospilota]|uniref:Phospholipase DDHD1 n=1 Tax=Holothuria leucospilota TaxID=206669 RepID=A0A9Q1HFD5_HOLLE|nr:Phospholipase DDHD1 [Holothuria leucospilota]